MSVGVQRLKGFHTAIAGVVGYTRPLLPPTHILSGVLSRVAKE